MLVAPQTSQTPFTLPLTSTHIPTDNYDGPAVLSSPDKPIKFETTSPVSVDHSFYETTEISHCSILDQDHPMSFCQPTNMNKGLIPSNFLGGSEASQLNASVQESFIHSSPRSMMITEQPNGIVSVQSVLSEFEMTTQEFRREKKNSMRRRRSASCTAVNSISDGLVPMHEAESVVFNPYLQDEMILMHPALQEEITMILYLLAENSTSATLSSPEQSICPEDIGYSSGSTKRRKRVRRTHSAEELYHTASTEIKTITCLHEGCDIKLRSPRQYCPTHSPKKIESNNKANTDIKQTTSKAGSRTKKSGTIKSGSSKRCSAENCAKAAQSRGLCKAHGGGVRCRFPDCTSSSQGRGLCRRHGGGKRCHVVDCPRGAQRGSFCAKHGGVYYCQVETCTRTDRGGGLCEVHRKGKICQVHPCNKLAREDGLCLAHLSK